MKHTEETKIKLRDIRIGKKYSAETKSKMSNSHKGKFHSEETKKKISDTMKLKKATVSMIDPWLYITQVE
jgi:hypothetical protein